MILHIRATAKNSRRGDGRRIRPWPPVWTDDVDGCRTPLCCLHIEGPDETVWRVYPKSRERLTRLGRELPPVIVDGVAYWRVETCESEVS